jgi:hypothetical protein
MSTLLTSLALIVAYLIFDVIREIVTQVGVFRHIQENYEEFLIDYSDCKSLTDRIALYIVLKK